MSGVPARGRHVSLFMAAPASIMLVALLSGCTLGEHYTVLDREAQPSDAPPPELAGRELPDVDLETLRFATEYEGDRLYLAKGRGEMRICLLVDGPGDDDVLSACGGGNWVGVQAGPSSHEYHAHPDGTPLPDDVYTDLTENISVKHG